MKAAKPRAKKPVKSAAKSAAPKKPALRKAASKKAAPKKAAKILVKKIIAKRAAAKSKAPAFDFDAFIERARDALKVKLARGVSDWGLGSYETFNVDQTRAVMEFSSGGEVRLRAKAQIVGSLSALSDTWLWAWANSSILEIACKELEVVRAFGKERKWKELTRESWPGTEADAWAMTAVAAFLLKSDCAYRVPTQSSYVFVLLDGLEKL